VSLEIGISGFSTDGQPDGRPGNTMPLFTAHFWRRIRQHKGYSLQLACAKQSIWRRRRPYASSMPSKLHMT